VHILEPPGAQSLETPNLGLHIVGLDIEVHTARVLDLLNFDVQSEGPIVESPVELSLRTRKLAHRHAEGRPPEFGGCGQIARLAIDDESSQFAFVHRFLQISSAGPFANARKGHSP
jgi:hypothetical protein